MNKLILIAVLAIIASFTISAATSSSSPGMTREEFIAALYAAEPTINTRTQKKLSLQELDTEAQVPASHLYPTKQEPNDLQKMISSMSPEEFRESLKKAGIKSRATRYENQQSVWEQVKEVFSTLADSSSTETTAVDGSDAVVSTSGDDANTKSLKRRAVIALAVFLPLLILSYIAFFVAIFFFIPGSNNPGANKNNSKNSKKSSTQHSDKSNRTKDGDRDDSSTHGSKTSQGGSRTKNVSTTI